MALFVGTWSCRRDVDLFSQVGELVEFRFGLAIEPPKAITITFPLPTSRLRRRFEFADLDYERDYH